MPSIILHFSFSLSLAERGSVSTSFQSSFILSVSSVSGTAPLRSSTSDTLEPFSSDFTALRLTLNPSGPSSPPSVKSTSPKSESATVPSITSDNPTFLSCMPQSIRPYSPSGVLLSICRSFPS